MHNLSTNQLLSLWVKLERAMRGESEFSGHICEIYLHTLMPMSFMVASFKGDPFAPGPRDMQAESAYRAYKEANVSLYQALTLFAEFHSGLKIEVGVTNFIGDWRELGPWLQDAPFHHRVHIKVTVIDEARAV